MLMTRPGDVRPYATRHRGARSPFKTTEVASSRMPDASEASRRPSKMTWSATGVVRLARLRHDERAVEARRQLPVVVQVRVVDERAGARRRDPHEEEPPGAIIGAVWPPTPLQPCTPS